MMLHVCITYQLHLLIYQEKFVLKKKIFFAKCKALPLLNYFLLSQQAKSDVVLPLNVARYSKRHT